MDWVTRNAPCLLLAGALVASATLTLALTASLTFFGDAWSVLMDRRELTPETVLAPHNEHIIAVPVLLQNLDLSLFGMEFAWPGQVRLTIALLVTACLLFVYVKRCLGPWPALFAASLLLFLGPAWETVLWPFEIGFVGSVGFGIAMLLALDRGDRRGDAVACACLVAALFCSSLGIPFVAAAAVDLLQKRRTRGVIPRLFVLAVPLLLFVAWYAGWGSDAETHLSLRNVLSSPRFVAEMVAFAAAGTLRLGTSPYGGVAGPGLGYALVVALAVGLGYRLARGSDRLPVGFWVVAAAAAANWFLTAFNQIPGREPTSSRYVYASAVFLLLMVASGLRGTRFGTRALVAMGAVTLAAISLNALVLKDGRNWLQNQTLITRADLTAIEIARSRVSPDFQLSPEIAGTSTLVNITAGEYLEASEEHGSPAYNEAELLEASAAGRRRADIVLSQALPISALIERDAFDADRARAGCAVVRPGSPPMRSEVRLSPGLTRIEVTPGSPADFFLRRFAKREYPVPTNGGPGGSVTELRVPSDEAPRYPWYLGVEASQLVYVCG